MDGSDLAGGRWNGPWNPYQVIILACLNYKTPVTEIQNNNEEFFISILYYTINARSFVINFCTLVCFIGPKRDIGHMTHVNHMI